MPTQRPRLTVTLTPAVNRALTAFSRASGTSKGAFILGVLESSLPVLERLAVTAQAAKRAQPEALAKIRQNITQLERVAMKSLGGLETATDLFLEPLPEPARAGGRAGRSTAAAGPVPSPVPPPSNRGVGTPPGPSKVTPIRRKRRD